MEERQRTSGPLREAIEAKRKAEAALAAAEEGVNGVWERLRDANEQLYQQMG